MTFQTPAMSVPTMGEKADQNGRKSSDMPTFSLSNPSPSPGQAPRNSPDSYDRFQTPRGGVAESVKSNNSLEPVYEEQAGSGTIMETLAATFHIGEWGSVGQSAEAIRRAASGTHRRASQAVADEQRRATQTCTPYERRRTTSSSRRMSAMLSPDLDAYAEEKNVPAQSGVFGIGDVNGTDTLIGQAPMEEREIQFPGKQDMVNAVSEAIALGQWADAATALAALQTATEQACRIQEAVQDIAEEDRENIAAQGIFSQMYRGFRNIVEELLVAMIVRLSLLLKMIMYCLYIVPPAMVTGLACSALLFVLDEVTKLREGKCADSGLGEQEDYQAPAQLLGGAVASFLNNTGIFGEWMGLSEDIEVTTAKSTPLYGCQRVVDSHRWMIYLLPFGGMLSAQLFKTFDVGSKPHFLRKDKDTAAAAGSSGTLFQGLEGTHYIPLRMTPLVWIGTVITHIFGGPAGREGTGVQMAASVTSTWCQYLSWAFDKCEVTSKMNPFKDRGFVKALMISSVGAGFAGIFGTPLTGGIFALEIMTVGQVEYQAVFPAIFASIIADYTCRGSNHYVFDKDLHTEYFCAKCAGHKWPQVAETGDIESWTWTTSEESIGPVKYGNLSGTCGTNTTGSDCSALPPGLTQAEIDSAKFKGTEGDGRYETGLSWFQSESKKYQRNGPPSAFYYMPFAPKQYFNAEDIVDRVQLTNPQSFGVWGQHEPYMLIKIFFSSIFFGLCGTLFAELIEIFKAFYEWLLPKAKCELKGWNFQYLAKPFVGGCVVVLLWMLVSAADNPFDFPSEYCGKRQGDCNGLPKYKYGDSYLGLGTKTPGVSISTFFYSSGDAVNFFTFLFKTLFTCLTLACGFKGGEVTPIFFIGAAAGNTAAYVWGEDAELFAALGLCATFAAATNTPMACAIMGFELFGGMTPLYFGEACFVAYLFSGNNGIYIKQFIAKASKSISGDLLSEGDHGDHDRGDRIANQAHAPDIKGLVGMISLKTTSNPIAPADLEDRVQGG